MDTLCLGSDGNPLHLIQRHFIGPANIQPRSPRRQRSRLRRGTLLATGLGNHHPADLAFVDGLGRNCRRCRRNRGSQGQSGVQGAEESKAGLGAWLLALGSPDSLYAVLSVVQDQGRSAQTTHKESS